MNRWQSRGSRNKIHLKSAAVIETNAYKGVEIFIPANLGRYLHSGLVHLNLRPS